MHSTLQTRDDRKSHIPLFHLSEICSALHLMVIGKSTMSLVVTMNVLCPDPSLYGFYRIPGLCCHKPSLLTVHKSTMPSRRYRHRVCLLHHNQWLHSAPSMGFPHNLQSAGSECVNSSHTSQHLSHQYISACLVHEPSLEWPHFPSWIRVTSAASKLSMPLPSRKIQDCEL